MQLDHMNIYVSDVSKSRLFYEKTLSVFGFKVVRDYGEYAVGLGDKNYAVLALVRQEGDIQTTHFAFKVDMRADVRRFYKVALATGGTDNGAPGLRPDYHENYYAAFIRDPDGHNLEFVCHHPDSDA
jgi:catechol 2,3-dioxygenase-like lactoylglutathione lyase family enzyme